MVKQLHWRCIAMVLHLTHIFWHEGSTLHTAVVLTETAVGLTETAVVLSGTAVVLNMTAVVLDGTIWHAERYQLLKCGTQQYRSYEEQSNRH